MRTTAAALIALAGLLASIVSASQSETAAPSTVRDVMITMTVPGSDAVFDAAADPPASDEQWAALRKGALTLAESGRLLTTGSRAREDAEWMEMARALVIEAERTLAVAEARDSAALEQAGEDVYVTCETCHARYLEGAQ